MAQFIVKLVTGILLLSFAVPSFAFDSITPNCRKYAEEHDGPDAITPAGCEASSMITVAFEGVTTTVGGLTTWGIVALIMALDVRRIEPLIDQAYAGEGETLELLVQTSNGLSLEQVSDTIISLDQAGQLDHDHPELMKKIISDAIQAAMPAPAIQPKN